MEDVGPGVETPSPVVGTAVWPPAPFAAAVRLDGRWLPRPGVARPVLLAVAVIIALSVVTPVVGGTPVPALATALLITVVAIGLLDALSGLAAALVGTVAAAVAVAAPTDAGAIAGLAVQALVVASLGCLVALAVTEIARELWRIVRGRLPVLPRGVDAVGAGLLAAGVAWFSVSGWIAASPVMYASAVPGATYEDLALGADVTRAVSVAMAVAGVRAAAVRLQPPRVRVLPVATGWWAVGGQLAGGATLLILLSSLFHGATGSLLVAAGLVVAARLVRCGLAPEPRLLLGGPMARIIGRVPPFGQMLLIVVPALGIAAMAGDAVESVRTAFLVCLVQVLLLAERGPAPFPARRDLRPSGDPARMV